MMLGMLVTSVYFGPPDHALGPLQDVSSGRVAIMTFGLLLLSRISADLSVWRTSMDALLLGFGMGMVMQVLVIAVQNSVDYEHLGVATSGTTLFRSVGGALGVALFGAIFTHGLHAHLAGVLPPDAIIPSDAASIAALPENIRAQYISAVVAALRPVLLVAAGVAALGFALTLMLLRVPLRGMAPAEGTGRSRRDAARCHLARGIGTHRAGADGAGENRWCVYSDLAARCRLDLPGAGALAAGAVRRTRTDDGAFAQRGARHSARTTSKHR